ncbi:flagellar basal body rod protein FlgC [Chengkuizengella marina]|uniref:Flagellar basal-body rod protein FlgC n=1 Tax=Chengkuizengella marina TaxID=2507566 RepID=A0A6N9PWS2_9BACL|nr:flagellar basal body rod protein FlgC [Chengkuizengella marina]NBI27356.1 flagellar basal body rod protein FlgC [Chengkuizengella marina]
MNLTNSFNNSSSALTAQRLRMDIISSNIANAETTRGKLVDGEWIPYQRKVVITEAGGQPSFDKVFQSKLSNRSVGNGVKVTQIVEDQSPFKRVYQPSHPDANEEGFVYMPNVDILKEMVDMISATRSYEANVTALNASKSMFMKALEIGR